MALDPAAYKDALAHWASGVTVVSTYWQGDNYGLTVSSFTSVSLEPPLVSISLSRTLYTRDVIAKSGIFGVSILAAEQQELGMRFAGLLPEVPDRFDGLGYHREVTGSPILTGCVAWLDCRLAQIVEAGDHSVFFGEVLAASTRPGAEPLLYYHRDWRQVA